MTAITLTESDIRTLRLALANYICLSQEKYGSQSKLEIKLRGEIHDLYKRLDPIAYSTRAFDDAKGLPEYQYELKKIK